MNRATRGLALAALAAGVAAAAPRAARAQTFTENQTPTVAGRERFKSPQHFAVEVRFGPYLPNVDSEFDGARHPYRDFFGTSAQLLSQVEVDYELFHRFGTVAVGAGFGYFDVTGTAMFEDSTGRTSTDTSTLTVLPFALSAVYRFDVFLERNRFPVVPFAKLGLDWAYWSISDGNGEIATDATGGKGRGGTLGWHGAVGLQLVLDFFDWDAARDFDADMGVNHTSIVFQMTHADISGLGRPNRLHVGDTNWSLGLMFQF